MHKNQAYVPCDRDLEQVNIMVCWLTRTRTSYNANRSSIGVEQVFLTTLSDHVLADDKNIQLFFALNRSIFYIHAILINQVIVVTR